MSNDKPIIIVGAGGRLGQELLELLRPEGAMGFTRHELDLTDPDAVSERITQITPGLIINAAALTDVDRAQNSPEQTFDINTLGPRNLAEAAREVEADLVYISTDYVFDGTKDSPYTEDDEPRPINVYGRSKLAGEYITRKLWERSYVIRTGILYGSFGQNFVQGLLDKARHTPSIQAITDQVAAPTSTRDLAKAIRTIAFSGRYGLYHVVNSGQASRYELASVTLDEAAKYEPDLAQVAIERISLAQAAKSAPRPPYTVLSPEKLAQELGYTMRNWQEPLREYVKYYFQSNN